MCAGSGGGFWGGGGDDGEEAGTSETSFNRGFPRAFCLLFIGSGSPRVSVLASLGRVDFFCASFFFFFFFFSKNTDSRRAFLRKVSSAAK